VSTSEIRTSLRMDEDLHRMLTEASEEHGRNFSDEVRARLAASFKVESHWQGDAETHELLIAISRMAGALAMFFGEWHEDPFSAQAFRMAIDKHLRLVEPKGEPIPKPKTEFSMAEVFRVSPTLDAISGVLVMLAVPSRVKEEPR